MKNKKIFFISLVAFIIILITIFYFFYYKSGKSGNTMINKSEEEIVDFILNTKCYKAKLDISVQTNKNKTQYVISQSLENGKSIQEVLEPKNIAGVITEYDGTNMKIRNNKLDLETTFQNYQYIVENSLWLDSFIQEYKTNKNKSINSNGNEIILNLKKEENLYHVYKELHIDKKTGKPVKMIVQDINKNTLIYILYTEITISI